jgi:hypothetical protein
MSETNNKMIEYIKSTPPDADPNASAIFFLCQEIDKLKRQAEENKRSWPCSPLNSYV